MTSTPLIPGWLEDPSTGHWHCTAYYATTEVWEIGPGRKLPPGWYADVQYGPQLGGTWAQYRRCPGPFATCFAAQAWAEVQLTALGAWAHTERLVRHPDGHLCLETLPQDWARRRAAYAADPTAPEPWPVGGVGMDGRRDDYTLVQQEMPL